MLVTTTSDYIPGGPFWARQDIFGSGGAQSITYDPTNFPANTRLRWNWPAPNGRVYSYPGLAWGNQYSGVEVIPGVQLNAFKTLSCKFDYSISANPAQYDVLNEMWLYAHPLLHQAPPPSPAQLFEVELLLEPLADGSVPSQNQFYVYSITQPFAADVLVNPKANFTPAGTTSQYIPSILIYPKKALIGKVTVDWRALYQQLIAKGTLTGNEYAYGFEFGAEVWGGSGSMNIRSWQVDWS
jgi:hypothetical protein